MTEKIKKTQTIAYCDKMRAIRQLQTARYTLRANQKRLQEEYDKKNAMRCDVVTGMLMNLKENLSEDVDTLTTELEGIKIKIEELSAKIEKIKMFDALLK